MMAISLSTTADPKRLEMALKESKETSLTGRLEDEPVIAENNTSLICRICGKLLQNSGNFYTMTLPETVCENCGSINNGILSEAVNKRDSGFHTMNREATDSCEKVESASTRNGDSTDTASISCVPRNSSGKYIEEPNINGKLHIEQVSKIVGKQEDVRTREKVTPKAFAENLFNCNGYKRTEVARILGKNSPFNQEVAREYLKFFNFTDEPLISSYRRFLSQFALLGETQERERVLSFFALRYIECNPNFLDRNKDSVHTLICALTLLNTDLHGNVGVTGRKKMTYKQFVANLSGLMSDGSDYPKDLLVSLYTSIKKSPLPWGGKEVKNVSRSSSLRQKSDQQFVRSPGKMVNRSLSSRTPVKPRKAAADSSGTGLGRSAKYKPLTENHGTLWRKTLIDSDGKKVPIGKRGWRVYTVTLRNLELHIAKKGSGEVKTISIHHTIAEDTTSDSKRSNVFKLMHSDSSVALYQASSDKEMRRWIREINKAAALLSAAPLCSPVGSQLMFRKALLPSAPSTLPAANQLKKLQQLLKEHEEDLKDTSRPVDDGSAQGSTHSTQYVADKTNYLKFEIRKYKCYIKILQVHLRVNTSSYEELKSSLDGSENGSLVSVTPSEPPLASPSAIDTFNNLAFPDTPEKQSVLSPPTHFTTPQHRSSALSPTSSLPNLSPILESPSILMRHKKETKSRTAELYESSLNDSDFVSAGNVNNSNTNPNALNPAIMDSDHRSSNERGLPKSQYRAEIQTTVIGLTTLPGGHKPFPVKRYEMRIAQMDPCKASISRADQPPPPIDGPVNQNLTRVKGRKEKKGIERYSYMQAVSPIENLN